jgi:hypothetical protein
VRIIKQRPGQSLTEGDLIMNLVYDKNTKFNFVVYGEFDLDQDGHPSANDTGVVRRLITQWGGRLMNDVNADTDFVILGKEPVVPETTPEDEGDPQKIKEIAEATQARDAYLNLRDKAEKLNIPIMNQNRFLYFVGYFDRAAQ